MILEKNKEIQYMNMRSIVLEISAKNSNGRGCTQKCLLQKASFWTNNFGTASAKEFKS